MPETSASTETQAETPTAAPAETLSAEGMVEEGMVEESLVEEVSIDGMCGVY
jgi:mycofactocin precursor